MNLESNLLLLGAPSQPFVVNVIIARLCDGLKKIPYQVTQKWDLGRFPSLLLIKIS